MKDGFIKVGAAVPEVRVGDCDYNADRIIERIKTAYEAGVRVLVLPELCVTSCSCGVLFLHSGLLNSTQRAVEKIVGETCELDIVCAVGAPLRVNGALRDCAVVFTKGKVLGIVSRRGISGDAARYFASGESGTCFVCKNLPDLNFEVVIGSDKPVTGAGIVLQMTAEPKMTGKSEYRRVSASVLSYENRCVLVSANAGDGESSANAVFYSDTDDMLIYENGKRIDCGQLTGISDADIGFIAYERRRCGFIPAAAETVEFSLDAAETKLTRRFSHTPFVPCDKEKLDKRCKEVFTIQSLGLEKRVRHTGAKKLVLGLSGGLDSTLALLVCCAAAEGCLESRRDVIAVTMPCFGTTSRTKSNAEKIAELFGVTLRTVDISEAVKLHFRDIAHDPELHNAAFENAQARERTQVLMDIANDVNGLVVGTGDMSELALGWATYGGDQMSMYGVNAGVPKTLIKSIIAYFAENGDWDVYSGSEDEIDAKQRGIAEVLRDIVDTPISPELLPDQKTEDSVGPYELHDFFLYHMIRRGSSPAKIYRLAKNTFAGIYDSATIKKWLVTFCRRFFSQQFKRSCSPDGVRVGSVSLSPADLKLPSDISREIWLKEAEALE